MLAMRPPRPCSRRSKRCELWEYTTLDRPACCTTAMWCTLSRLVEIMERNGIAYFLDFGTLLGAVRAEDFIPWDYDVDIGIFHDDLARFLALENTLISEGFIFNKKSLQRGGIKLSYSQLNNRRLDVDIWRRYPDGMYRCAQYSEFDAIPASILKPLGTCILRGRNFRAPTNPPELLTQRYGSDWTKDNRHWYTPNRKAGVKLNWNFSPMDKGKHRITNF